MTKDTQLSYTGEIGLGDSFRDGEMLKIDKVMVAPLHNILRTMELYTLKGRILWYMKNISIEKII